MNRKPITGSWLDFRHPNPHEGDYWNDTVRGFSPHDWREKLAEMAGLGMDTVVLTSVALERKAFYPSEVIRPRWELSCDDPVDALLSAADGLDMKVFLGAGYFGRDTGAAGPADSEERSWRRRVPAELQERYGKRRSFHGWYLPVEAEIREVFSKPYLSYLEDMNAHCRASAPEKPILIAPYGTRTIQPDTSFREQIERLPVNFITYQDEVGVRKTAVAGLPGIFDGLRRIHRDLPVPLWADMEVFTFEGRTYGSPLVPAPFSRVRGQLEAIGPRVEKILCYQYPGLMNPADSKAFAGNPGSTALYAAYSEWLASR